MQKKSFLRDASGQDLIEYTLLMTFVALASAALFIGAGGSIKGIWKSADSTLATAQSQSSNFRPLTLVQVRQLLAVPMPDHALAGEIMERGIDFRIDTTLMNELAGEGAGFETIHALRDKAPGQVDVSGSTLPQAILWVAAAGVLLIFLTRRRSRRRQ